MVFYAQNAGFQFKGHLGYASYNSYDVKTEYHGGNFNSDFNSSAIHFGLETSYLYDFIYNYNQTHTFGANADIGYEFGAFIGPRFILHCKLMEFSILEALRRSLTLILDKAFLQTLGFTTFIKVIINLA